MEIFYNTSLSLNFTNYSPNKPFEKISFLLDSIRKRKFKDIKGQIVVDRNYNSAEPKIYTLFGTKDLLIMHDLVSHSFLNESLNSNIEDNNTEIVFDQSIQNVSGFSFIANLNQVVKGHSNFSNHNSVSNILRNFDKAPFICIVQLKINNALLFSFGTEIVLKTVYKIEEILERSPLFIDGEPLLNYIINYSFSAYELILTIAHEDHIVLNKMVMDIRELKFSDVLNNIETTIPISFLEVLGNFENEQNQFDFNTLNKKLNLFSDTQTTYGIQLEELNGSFLLKNVKLSRPDEGIKFKIEFKVKPSFIKLFKYLIDHVFSSREIPPKFYSIIGKADYIYNLNVSFDEYKKIYYLWLLCGDESSLSKLIGLDESASICYHEIKALVQNDKNFNKIGHLIRNINTRIYFELKDDLICIREKDIETHLPHANIVSHIQKLSFNSNTVKRISDKLEMLNLSSHLRNKFLKMYLTHNHGMATTVTFNLHLETYYFLKNATEFLEKYIEVFTSEYGTIPLSKLQPIVEAMIDNYENANIVRAIQPFGHDNGLELLINYNSNIQNFISDIDSLLKLTIGGINKFVSSDPELFHDTFALMDYMRPNSNVYFTNFHLLDVFSPVNLFNYMIQESLVVLMKKDRNLAYHANFTAKNLTDKYLSYFENTQNKNIYSDLIKIIFTYNNNQIQYLLKDYARYKVFFCSGSNEKKEVFDKYYFCQMLNVMQNSTMYLTNGELNEKQAICEITRLLLIFLIEFDLSEKKLLEIFLTYNPYSEDKRTNGYIIWRKLSV